MALMPAIIDQLQQLVGANRVLIDQESFARYGVDRTTVWRPAPGAVVLPESTERVQAIVQLANREKLAVVPSGGRTGLSGGALSRRGEIVIAMDRMNKITGFNAVDKRVTCQAGVITRQLQEFAGEKGLFYPVDFASSGSSQIGGNIATNAGGIKVIRYGMTRDWVLGLTVVTGGGEILNLNRGLVKNNAGYDFRHLFIGSEGTLGIICEAAIKLAVPADALSVMVLGVSGFPAVMDVLQTFSHAPAGKRVDLTAFEFFSHPAMAKVMEHSGVAAPFATEAPYYALLEFEHRAEADMGNATALFENCVEQGWVLDGVISQSLTQARNLWRLREDISETISFCKPYKNDVSVSISQMPGFIDAVNKLVNRWYPDFEIIWFGHIGDGNLHLNILKPQSWETDAFVEKCGSVTVQVAKLLNEYGGSISAEHGIGLLKKDYLHYTRSEAEIALMKQVKQAFDPNGIMNPGKLFD